MKKFLEKVSEFILEKKQGDLLKTAVIFPNKRSEVFLKDHLRKKTTKNLWLPDFFTIDEFVQKVSGLVNIDPVQVYFELFEIHKKLAGADAREIDDFLSWAPIMLSDFNDIDTYLADTERIFSHLSEIRAMEVWNTDGKPLTELQQNYLSFYNSLIDYYKQLQKNLLVKNAAYTGMSYRHLVDNIETKSKEWTWENFILVGFSALSLSEQKIFDFLNSGFNTEFLWDVDTFYFSRQGKMEAGSFISKMLEHFKHSKPKWVGDSLLKSKKKITILGTSKQIGQAKYTGIELKNRFKKTANETTDTAVVLADENLLVPLLNSLPEIKNEDNKTVGYNITMGYPVSNGPVSQFINDWLNLLISQAEQTDKLYSMRNFMSLLNNPVVQTICNQPGFSKTEEIKSLIVKAGFSLFSKEKFEELIRKVDSEKTEDLIALFLPKNPTPQEFTNALVKFLFVFKQSLNDTGQSNFLLKEQLVLMFKLTKKLQRLVDINFSLINLKALQKIVSQLIRRSEVNLKGEPLSGIQIMGMLETRNLDFKNIIILSANEGILPKSETIESFIPFDIRAHFKLPLPKDKTDIYAYHFYRLLQRAKNVTLVYDSESGQLGGGEPSRYILQLKSELSKLNTSIQIEEKLIDFPPPESSARDEIEIPKEAGVMELIHQKLISGLSPSSLSTFINCSLQFYFSQLLKLKSSDELEKSIESDVFGTVVHGVLEELYRPFVGSVINTSELSKRLTLSDKLLRNMFLEQFHKGELSTGKNYLTVEVARKYIQRFVTMDIAELKKQATQLLAVEKKFTTAIKVNGQKVILKGTVDRIDSGGSGSSLRLIDYKTGAVEPKDLKLKDWEDLILDPKHQKIFQLLFYTFLFEENNQKKNPLAGIYSLRKPSEGFLSAILPDDADWKESKETFQQMLDELISKLINPELPFSQTEDEERCNWCDFKNICNRKESSNF